MTTSPRLPAPRPTSAERAAAYRAAGLWGARRLADGLEAHAALSPDRVAVIDDRRQLTWSELASAVGRAVGGLSALGIAAGDPVLVVTDNSIDGVIAIHAALRAGAPALLLDRRSGPADVRAALDAVAGPVPIVVPDHLRDRLGLADVATVDPSTLAAADEPARWAEPDRGVPAIVLFTSGTTGRPKAVVHSLDTMTANVTTMAGYTRCSTDDTLFLVSPLASSAGVTQLLLAADHHATFALVDDFDPEITLDRLDAVRGTLLGGAPVIAERLLGAAVARDRTTVPFRLLSLGGAMLPRPLLELATDRFGIEIVRVYGSSEAPNFSASLPTDDRAARLADDGALTPGAEVRIGSAEHPAEGLVRGPAVFLGYLDPADDEAAFDGDWFRTGDLIEVTGGRLTVTGRLKEVVNRAGEKVSLAEIDQALAGLTGATEHATFAVADHETGERLAVAVVPAPGRRVGLDDVTAHLVAAGVARRKLPEQLVTWPGPLPRTASGKVIRSQLVRDAPALPAQLGARLRREMPVGLRHVRTTPVFTDRSVPAGLRRAHRVADGVWGRLVVHEGDVTFVFEDPPGTRHLVEPGDHLDIPPAMAHRVEPGPGARFAVEFHAPPADRAG